MATEVGLLGSLLEFALLKMVLIETEIVMMQIPNEHTLISMKTVILHVKGDCDDSEYLIYPNAHEVANDDIDQDCDGKDTSKSLVPVGITVVVLMKMVRLSASVLTMTASTISQALQLKTVQFLQVWMLACFIIVQLTLRVGRNAGVLDRRLVKNPITDNLWYRYLVKRKR